MRTLLAVTLALLPLGQAQDVTKEIGVSIEVDTTASPVMVRAAYPGLPLAAVRELLQKKFEAREMPYTDTIMVRVPPGPTTAQPLFMPVEPNPKPPEAIRVSAEVMKKLAVVEVAPVYPDEAKARHVEGSVALSVTIDKQGKVVDVRGMTGHPLLMEAALAAVAQWEYKPLIVSDKPVMVITEAEVRFALL